MLTTQARATGSPSASRPAFGACAAKAWMSSKGARRFEPMCRSQLSQVARRDGVVLEDRGVVDEHRQRPAQRRRRRRHQRRGRRPVEQVGLHHRRPHAGRRAPPRPAPRPPSRLAWQWIATSAPRAASARTSAAPSRCAAAGDQRRARSCRAATRHSGAGAGLGAADHVGAAVGTLARRLTAGRCAADFGSRSLPSIARSSTTATSEEDDARRSSRRQPVAGPERAASRPRPAPRATPGQPEPPEQRPPRRDHGEAHLLAVEPPHHRHEMPDPVGEPELDALPARPRTRR